MNIYFDLWVLYYVHKYCISEICGNMTDIFHQYHYGPSFITRHKVDFIQELCFRDHVAHKMEVCVLNFREHCKRDRTCDHVAHKMEAFLLKFRE